MFIKKVKIYTNIGVFAFGTQTFEGINLLLNEYEPQQHIRTACCIIYYYDSRCISFSNNFSQFDGVSATQSMS